MSFGGFDDADDHVLRLRAEAQIACQEGHAVLGGEGSPGMGQVGDLVQLWSLHLHTCRPVRRRRQDLLDLETGIFQLLAQPETQFRRPLEQPGAVGVDSGLATQVGLLDEHRTVLTATNHHCHRMPWGSIGDRDDDRRQTVVLAVAEAEQQVDAVDLDLATVGGQDLTDLGQLRRPAQHAQGVQLVLDLRLELLLLVLRPSRHGLGLLEQELQHQLVVEVFLASRVLGVEGPLKKPEGHIVPRADARDGGTPLGVLEAQHGAAFQELDGEDGAEEVVITGDAGEHLLRGIDGIVAVELKSSDENRPAGVAPFGVGDAVVAHEVVVVTTASATKSLSISHGFSLQKRRVAAKLLKCTTRRFVG